MRQQILIPTLLEIAKELDIDILVEPSRGIYGVLKFKSGYKHYIKDVNLNLNLSNSVSLAKNKAATSFFLKEFGYHVPDFTIIRSKRLSSDSFPEDTKLEGYEYAKIVGFPVILKPNDMSQGNLIFKVYEEKEYYSAAREILTHCKSAQVQRFYPGNDYRIVVLRNRVISAYQRIPFHVVGDGISSIAMLIDLKQNQFVSLGRDTKLSTQDLRLQQKLQREGLSLNSIPTSGDKVFLQDISNLSVGGETVELTSELHQSYADLAINIAKDMNLSLCGIDIITESITRENNDLYTVLEVNSSPGLDNYAFSGAKQESYVKSLYREVLIHIQGMYL